MTVVLATPQRNYITAKFLVDELNLRKKQIIHDRGLKLGDTEESVGKYFDAEMEIEDQLGFKQAYDALADAEQRLIEWGEQNVKKVIHANPDLAFTEEKLNLLFREAPMNYVITEKLIEVLLLMEPV